MSVETKNSTITELVLLEPDASAITINSILIVPTYNLKVSSHSISIYAKNTSSNQRFYLCKDSFIVSNYNALQGTKFILPTTEKLYAMSSGNNAFTIITQYG